MKPSVLLSRNVSLVLLYPVGHEKTGTLTDLECDLVHWFEATAQWQMQKSKKRSTPWPTFVFLIFIYS